MRGELTQVKAAARGPAVVAGKPGDRMSSGHSATLFCLAVAKYLLTLLQLLRHSLPEVKIILRFDLLALDALEQQVRAVEAQLYVERSTMLEAK